MTTLLLATIMEVTTTLLTVSKDLMTRTAVVGLAVGLTVPRAPTTMVASLARNLRTRTTNPNMVMNSPNSPVTNLNMNSPNSPVTNLNMNSLNRPVTSLNTNSPSPSTNLHTRSLTVLAIAPAPKTTLNQREVPPSSNVFLLPAPLAKPRLTSSAPCTSATLLSNRQRRPTTASSLTVGRLWDSIGSLQWVDICR